MVILNCEVFSGCQVHLCCPNSRLTTEHSGGNGWLTFSFLFLHAFSPPVDGGHLRLEGEVVVPDVLQLLLKERDPLQTVHLLQVSWGGQWKGALQVYGLDLFFSRPRSNRSDLDLNETQSRQTAASTVWYLHIWKLHLYTRGDLAWLSRCWLWSASACLWYLWLEGGDRPWHLGDAATLASGALLLETADLAAPSTTDWSSLSLLLAGWHKQKKDKTQIRNPQIPQTNLHFAG